jgi:MFS family permease
MVATYLQTLRRFNRDVRLYLVTATLIGFAAFGGIYPVLLNLYLLRLGYGPEFIGLINATGLFVLGGFCLPAGVLGGRWGIRRMMITGLGLTIVGYGLLPLAGFIPPDLRAGWLLTSYLIGELGIALYVVNGSPFLMGTTGSEERSLAFSAQAAVTPLAGFGGSLAGGLLPGGFAVLMGVSLENPTPYGCSLLVAAVALIPAVVAMLGTHEISPTQTEETLVTTEPPPYHLIGFLALVALLKMTGEGTARTFLNVYLDAGLQVPTARIGLLSAIGQLVAAPAAMVAPILMRRCGKERTYVGASLGIAACSLPLALVPHWGAAGLGFMGVMALTAITRPAITVYQQEIVSPGWRAIMSGATTTAAATSWAAMAFGGGYIIASLGYRAVFLIGAGLTTIGALLFWAYFRTPRGEFARR